MMLSMPALPLLPSLGTLFAVSVILVPVLLCPPQTRKKLLPATVTALALAVPLVGGARAFDLFIECDWDALVSTYGEALAWVYWVMAGC